MNSDTKWITIQELKDLDTGKTQVFQVLAKQDGVLLGTIKWFGRWRKYAFFPEPETVYENDCLNDISIFISGLMLHRKLKKQKILN